MSSRRVILFAAPLLLAPLEAVSGDPLEKTPEVAPAPEEGTVTIGGARFVARIESRGNRTARVSLRAVNPGRGAIATRVKVELVEQGAVSAGERMGPEVMTIGARTVDVELEPGAELGKEIVFKTRLSAKRAAYLIKHERLWVQVTEPDEERADRS